MIAEIRDAADTDARGDVGGRPAGQDRDRDALRPCLRDPGQPPERAPGERHDRGRAGVSRALGQGPVEVGDDEQPARAGRPTRRSRRSRLTSAPVSASGRARGSRRDVDPGQDGQARSLPPPTLGTDGAGLGWPTWKAAAPGGLAEPPGGLAERSARATRSARARRWARPIPRPTERGRRARRGRRRRRRRVGGRARRALRAPAPRRRSRPRGRRRSTGVPSYGPEGTSTSGRRRFDEDRCYHAAPMRHPRPVPHADRARRPHRARRRLPGRRAAVVHEPGHRRPRRDRRPRRQLAGRPSSRPRAR